MPVNVGLARKIDELRVVELENDWIRLSILPDVGAKIYDLVWKPTSRNFLWHNPRISPQAYPIDGNFDNYWCGGWDDGFPTCDGCEYRGEHYPNLGELRSVHWKVESASCVGEDAVAELTAFGPISPVQAVKTVTLAGRAPAVRVRHEISNLGPLPLEFIWGTHPALQVREGMLMRIPARTGIVGQATDPQLGTPGQQYVWPNLETSRGVTDMSRVQGIDARIACGHYAMDFEAGWYAVEDTETGEGFLFMFPLEQCPYLWMWLVYGGWRGYHHIILEPWTSFPNTLAAAAQQNTQRSLQPGEVFSVEVQSTIYSRPESYHDALRRLA